MFLFSNISVPQKQTPERNGHVEKHSRASRSDAFSNGTQNCRQNWQIAVPAFVKSYERRHSWTGWGNWVRKSWKKPENIKSNFFLISSTPFSMLFRLFSTFQIRRHSQYPRVQRADGTTSRHPRKTTRYSVVYYTFWWIYSTINSNKKFNLFCFFCTIHICDCSPIKISITSVNL